MPFKDHYRTLGVPPSADFQEIRKAYRTLAHRHHPDKDQANPFAGSYFAEIREAYEVLGDERKRKIYDEERYFRGLTAQKEPQRITGEWLLGEARKLSAHMEQVDSYRMNHKALHDYAQLLLSDAHLAVLRQEHNPELSRQIITELLHALKKIHYGYFSALTARISQVAGSQNELHRLVYTAQRQRQQSARAEKYLPVIVIVIAAILCLIMYWYSRRGL